MSTVAAIRVVCPSWCEVTEAEHAEELTDPFMAGDVTHHKSASMVSVRHTTRPDGTTYPDELKPGILIDAEADIEGAELLVTQLEEALRALRA